MYLLLAVFAARIQHIATKYRRNAFNGLLTVQTTLERETDAPMIYRVLIPFLMRRKPRSSQLYEFWRTVLLWIALMLVGAYWGRFVAVVWLVFVLSAQMYDTWCYTSETIGITLAMFGDPIGAALGVFIHGLSRETVLINGVVYWLASGDAIGGAIITALACAVFLGVRWYQGYKPLYCDRFMIGENWHILTRRKKPKTEGDDILFLYGAYLNLIVIALSLLGAFLVGAWFVPVMILATVTMGKINEYRLQIAVMPFAAYVIERIMI